MGCLFSSEREVPLSTAVHVEIEAPIDRVWGMVTDIQGLPKIVSHVDRVEFPIQGGQHDDGVQHVLEVGMRWMETRRLTLEKGSNLERQVKTIVKLEADGPTRALGVNIGFPLKNGRCSDDITNTCTFTVHTMNDLSCVLICSVAFHVVGMNWIPRRFLERLFLKHAHEYLLREVEDYRSAAEENCKTISVNDSTTDK